MSIFNIAWKLIFSKKQFSYTTFSIFISLIVSILSIATSISILGISRDYEDSVKKSISQKILLNFNHEVQNFVQICPKEMLDKLSNPLSVSKKVSKAV